jgi:hypothetical protein
MANTSPRASLRDHPVAPMDWPGEDREWSRKLAEVMNNMTVGRTNNTGTVTLTAASATTTLTDARLGATSVVTFMPTTANAATDLANLYVSARGKQTATLTHTNNAEADRTYGYSISG